MADRNRATLTIYTHQRAQEKQLLERLRKLAEQKDRSANYLALQAILEYLEREGA